LDREITPSKIDFAPSSPILLLLKNYKNDLLSVNFGENSLKVKK
jgi:hypothetical protein